MPTPNRTSLRLLLSIAVQALVVSYAAAQFGIPGKPIRRHPVVLLLDSPMVNWDYQITDGEANDIAKEVAKRSLKVKELPGFTFYYSEKALHIDEAKRQAQLLNECADVLASDPLRIVPLSKLSPNSQATLRGLFVSGDADDRSHKAVMNSAPSLLAGLSSSGIFRLGGLGAKFQTLPHSLPEEMRDVLTVAPQKDAQLVSPYSSSVISFMFGMTIPPEDRLRYLHTVQDFLKSECDLAKRAFDKASLKAQKSIYALYAPEYDHLLSLGHPKLKDFSLDDQKEILATLKPGPGPDIADLKQFLLEATADDFKTEFSLTCFVQAEGKLVREDIRFVCPIRP